MTFPLSAAKQQPEASWPTCYGSPMCWLDQCFRLTQHASNFQLKYFIWMQKEGECGVSLV